MNVSACLVTRGDVPMEPIIESLTAAGIDDIVVWDNSERANLAVYGRYAAIDDAKHELIFVQDDDVLLTREAIECLVAECVFFPVVNMPQRFRHEFYKDHSLVGFGACFNRNLPDIAFQQFGYRERLSADASEVWGETTATGDRVVFPDARVFRRTCDIVFTALTPRNLVDLPYTDREFASAPNRMWKQPEHVAERTRMLELVRQVRDREAA